MKHSTYFAVFAFFFVFGTWKLLEPQPVPEAVAGELGGEAVFVVGKTLHVLGYAFITFLAGTLPISQRWRYRIILVLVLHAIATEILQAVLPFNRTGRVADVLLDWLGIGLMVLILRFRAMSRVQS